MKKFDYAYKIIIEEKNKDIQYKHEFVLIDTPSTEDLNRIKAVLTKRFSDYDTKILCNVIKVYDNIEEIVKQYTI